MSLPDLGSFHHERERASFIFDLQCLPKQEQAQTSSIQTSGKSERANDSFEERNCTFDVENAAGLRTFRSDVRSYRADFSLLPSTFSPGATKNCQNEDEDRFPTQFLLARTSDISAVWRKKGLPATLVDVQSVICESAPREKKCNFYFSENAMNDFRVTVSNISLRICM